MLLLFVSDYFTWVSLNINSTRVRSGTRFRSHCSYKYRWLFLQRRYGSSGKPEEKEAFLQAFRKQYVPNRILVVVTEGKELESHAKVIPFIQKKYALNGKATAYVCEKAYCKLPAQDPALFSQQISEVVKLKDEPKI